MELRRYRNTGDLSTGARSVMREDNGGTSLDLVENTSRCEAFVEAMPTKARSRPQIAGVGGTKGLLFSAMISYLGRMRLMGPCVRVLTVAARRKGRCQLRHCGRSNLRHHFKLAGARYSTVTEIRWTQWSFVDYRRNYGRLPRVLVFPRGGTVTTFRWRLSCFDSL